MVNEVKVDAEYSSSSQVPRIGQRKRMKVNGCVQMMTLNSLTVTRSHDWADDAITHVFTFKTEELWGGYYECAGRW